MLHKFSRLVKVIGEDDFSILNKSKVLVLGCGFEYVVGNTFCG